MSEVIEQLYPYPVQAPIIIEHESQIIQREQITYDCNDGSKSDQIIGRAFSISLLGMSLFLMVLAVVAIISGLLTYFRVYETKDAVYLIHGISRPLQEKLIKWQFAILINEYSSNPGYRLIIFAMGMFLLLVGFVNLAAAIIQNRVLLAVALLMFTGITLFSFVILLIASVAKISLASGHCHELIEILGKNNNAADVFVIMKDLDCCESSLGKNDYGKAMNCCRNPEFCQKKSFEGPLEECCHRFIKVIQEWSIFVHAFLITLTIIFFAVLALFVMMIISFAEIDAEVNYLRYLIRQYKDELNQINS